MKDILLAVVFAFVLVGLVMGIVVGVDSFFRGKTCVKQAEMMGLEYKYGAIEGCMINHPIYGWIPFDKYFILMGNEGK
jgi:hypothetical protein